jgi:L-malate glycosyltransferase
MSATASPNVLLVQRRLTNYRVELFDLVRAHLLDHRINLRVCVGPTGDAELSRKDGAASASVPVVPMVEPSICGLGGYLHRLPVEWLRSASLVIAQHENRALTTAWLLACRRRYGFKVALWGHGANFSKPDEAGFSRWYRQRTIAAADWYFAYTARTVGYLEAIGFARSRITVLNNSKRTYGPDLVSADQVAAVRAV